MDIQTILQDEKKKKILIVTSVALLLIICLIFFLTRTGGAPEDNNEQLLSDIALLAPKDNLSQNADKLNRLPVITLTADNVEVSPGQPTIISWTSPNAVSCADGNGNDILTTGSISVTPTEPQTMDVVCTNSKGTSIESIMVGVTTAPIIALSAYPSSVKAGDQSSISWNTINTTRCVDSSGKTLRLSDSFSVVVKTPYTFKMSCVGPKGESKNSVTVTIAPPQTKIVATKTTITTTPKTSTTTSTTLSKTQKTIVPKVKTAAPAVSKDGKSKLDASANKTTVKNGESATVTWTTTNVKPGSCVGSTTTGVKLISPIDIPEKNIVKGGTMLNLQPGYEVPLEDNGFQEIRVLKGDKANLIIRCESSDGSIIEKIITIKADTDDKEYCLGTSNPASKKFGKGSASLELDGNLAIAGGTSRDVTYTAECATDCNLTITPWAESIVRYTEEEYTSLDINQSNPDWSIKGLEPFAGLIGSPDTGATLRVYPGKPMPAGTSGSIPAPTTSSDSDSSTLRQRIHTPQTVTIKLSCGSKYGAAGTKDTTAGRRTAESVTSIIPPAPSGGCGKYVSCIIKKITAVVVGGVCSIGVGGACVAAAVTGYAAVQ